MRTLPKNKSEKQKLIIKVVYDYYGGGSTRANQVAVYLMGRKKGVNLTEKEMSDLWAIKTNMTDKVYMQSFAD
ncbi:MAG: hypothetical protein WC933_02765 [Candidatus Paceibacterota bacterium]|jgi:hypothetical protein